MSSRAIGKTLAIAWSIALVVFVALALAAHFTPPTNEFTLVLRVADDASAAERRAARAAFARIADSAPRFDASYDPLESFQELYGDQPMVWEGFGEQIKPGPAFIARASLTFPELEQTRSELIRLDGVSDLATSPEDSDEIAGRSKWATVRDIWGAAALLILIGSTIWGGAIAGRQARREHELQGAA